MVNHYRDRRSHLLETREYLYYPQSRRSNVLERIALTEARKHLLAYVDKYPMEFDPWTEKQMRERYSGDWEFDGAILDFSIAINRMESLYLTEEQGRQLF